MPFDDSFDTRDLVEGGATVSLFASTPGHAQYTFELVLDAAPAIDFTNNHLTITAVSGATTANDIATLINADGAVTDGYIRATGNGTGTYSAAQPMRQMIDYDANHGSGSVHGSYVLVNGVKCLPLNTTGATSTPQWERTGTDTITVKVPHGTVTPEAHRNGYDVELVINGFSVHRANVRGGGGNMAIYVDAGTGLDTNSGLNGSPIQTTTRLKEIHPLRMSGILLIVITGDTSANPLEIGDVHFEGGGWGMISGDTTMTSLGGGGTSSSYTAGTIVQSGAGWSANQHRGKIVKHANSPDYRMVESNDSDTLYLENDFNTTPSSDSTFDFVRPASRVGEAWIHNVTGYAYFQVQRLDLNGSFNVQNCNLSAGVWVMALTGGTGHNYRYNPGKIFLESYLLDTDFTETYLNEWIVPNGSDGTGVPGLIGEVCQYLSVDAGFWNNIGLDNCDVTFGYSGANGMAGLTLTMEDCRPINAIGEMFRSTPISLTGINAQRCRLTSSVDITTSAGGVLLKNSTFERVNGLCTLNSSGHCLELAEGSKWFDSAAGSPTTGAGGVAGAGLYIHQFSQFNYFASNPPTLDGGDAAPGEITNDGTTEQATWAAITGGTDYVNATSDMIIVRAE